MRALSLFSGIGGLDLAAELCGIETAAFCEIEPYAVKVLERRWHGVPIIDDVRKVKGCDWTVDVVHGGFPCQDLSVAGKQAGLEGARSGLWFEMLRVISEIRPAYVLAENVRGACNLALPTVVSGLEGEGYEVRASVVPASAFGAPHKRERLFVLGIRKDVADSACERLQRSLAKEGFECGGESGRSMAVEGSGAGLWPTPTSTERSGVNPNTGSGAGLSKTVRLWPTPRQFMYKDSTTDRNKGNIGEKVGGQLNPAWVEILMGFPLGWTDVDCDEPEPWPGWPALMGDRLWGTHTSTGACRSNRFLENADKAMSPVEFVQKGESCYQHPYEPPRTVTGCPNRAKRLKCLGNAVVPAQARPFFEAIRQIHHHIICECFT